MSKKLYVPDHVAEKAIKAGFRDNQPKSKNEDDPSEMEASSLERLPQPTGYRRQRSICNGCCLCC